MCAHKFRAPRTRMANVKIFNKRFAQNLRCSDSLSTQVQPDFTWKSLQEEWIFGLTFVRRISLFVRIPSRTSLSTASLVLSEAISDLLKTLCGIF